MRRFHLACFAFSTLLPIVARADALILQTKGPWTGSIGSSPAALQEKGDNQLALISAQVKIRIKHGSGEELLALCSAAFVIHDLRAANEGEQELQMAFPVTGMDAKIVTVGDFVAYYGNDRNNRPTVTRHPIVVSPASGLKPSKFDPSGQMEGELYPEVAANPFVRLRPYSIVYHDAYLWRIKSNPGSMITLHVDYVAHLRPQEIRYSKAYLHTTDRDVIPFDDVPASQWDKRYYFFDYILVSGSTWQGPIERETVEVDVDPDLQGVLGQIESNLKLPTFSRELRDHCVYGFVPKTTGIRWEIKGKPLSDLIFGLPIK